MRVYLTGADGMLGSALTTVRATHPATADWTVKGVSVRDIADTDAVRASVEEFGHDLVVHTAANAIVDECGAEPRLALRTNIQGTSDIAAACRAVGGRLVHISSYCATLLSDGGPVRAEVPR